jgi:hypothetical protein
VSGPARSNWANPVPELSFEVAGIDVEQFAAVPTLMLRLRITEHSDTPIQAIALRAQIRIEPQLRRYDAEEGVRLGDLFGESSQWGDSLKPFLWMHISQTIGAFQGTTEVSLPMVCTYDFEVTGTKYLHALGDGEIPLVLLFNGTIFRTVEGGLMVEPVPWHLEARYRLPVARWRELMDTHFPGSSWLRIERDTFDALSAYKSRCALPTWELAIERLLKLADEDPS